MLLNLTKKQLTTARNSMFCPALGGYRAELLMQLATARNGVFCLAIQIFATLPSNVGVLSTTERTKVQVSITQTSVTSVICQ